MTKKDTIIYTDASCNERIDVFLARHLSVSRSKMTHYIKQGCITKNKKIVTKTHEIVNCNDIITYDFEEKKNITKKPDNIIIPLLHTHADFLIINKPAGISAHQSHENSDEFTLSDWIKENDFFHYDDKNNFIAAHDLTSNRAGIVHRLDKNTSGLMIIAKNYDAQHYFIDLFKNHHVKKKYYALVAGTMSWQTIEIKSFIMRDLQNPTRMISSLSSLGKYACTVFNLIKQYDNYALLECLPLTGRTHQIRVHCSAHNFPILGDEIYGKKSDLIARQALHAFSLKFNYQNESFNFAIDLPDDMKNLV